MFDGQPEDPVVGMAKAISLEVESMVDQNGWDQPAMVFFVSGVDLPGEKESQLRDMVESKFAAGQEAGSFPPGEFSALTLGISSPLEVPGHPYEALIGVRTPGDALAVVLAMEGWRYSDDTLKMINSGLPVSVVGQPSDQDDSVEVRLVYCLFRDGTEAFVQRDRDGEVNPILTSGLEGRVTWALRTAVGRPSGASITLSPREAAARSVERTAEVVAKQSAEALAEVPLQKTLDMVGHIRGDGNEAWDIDDFDLTLVAVLLMMAIDPNAGVILGALSLIEEWGELSDRLDGIPQEVFEASEELAVLREVADWADAGLLCHHVCDLLGVEAPDYSNPEAVYSFERPIAEAELGESLVSIFVDVAASLRSL